MDYLQQSLWFKIKKGWRYVQLYGILRTLAKIRGQYHLRKRYSTLPQIKHNNPKAHVGIIGCGNFAYSTIAYFLIKHFGRVIAGVIDIDPHHAASLATYYKANYYTTDAEKILNDPRINLVFIASNHASHAEYAIQALQQGKSVHIEKPHVVNEGQLVRLCRAMRESSGKVRVGFPRPQSNFLQLIQQHLKTQSGPALFSWFVVGHELPSDHWYYKKEEGGRILGNLAHWIDLTYRIVPYEGRFPIKIVPIRHEKSDHDIAVNYLFGDGTIATLSFSAKGHAFEGVRERFVAQKGDALITMDDFQHLAIEIVDKKVTRHVRRRDQGHEAAIVRSYDMSSYNHLPGEDIPYIWESGLLMLKTKEALERNTPIEILSYDPRILDARATS